MHPEINSILREKFIGIVKKNNLEDNEISIKAKVLTPEQAIGNPEHKDYPIIKGKEKMLEASYCGSKGVAFTDHYGNYSSSLYKVMNMELKTNFHRAIFISSINAVLRFLKLIDKTGHCKNEQLIECACQVTDYLKSINNPEKIGVIGYQPRFVEYLQKTFLVRVADMDADNINKEKNNILIEPPENKNEIIAWADLIFVTGSTFVNNTAGNFIDSGKETVFYGVTCAGACYLLNQKRYCPCGS